MKVKIKRIDSTLPLPTYHTIGAAAFDIYSREEIIIPAKSLGRIPTNYIIKVPQDFMLVVVPRSSTPPKGLSIPHGIGIIDPDYSGPTDEILFQTYNFTDADVTVKRGERIGQATFIRVDQMEWEEVAEMTGPNRGGFGSTGN